MVSNRLHKIILYGLSISCFSNVQAVSANENQPSDAAQQTKKMGGLSGTPVNSAIAGGVTVPEKKLVTVFNASFRDKDSIVDDNGKGARTLSNDIYLLKLRYGFTDSVEFFMVPGYINNKLDSFNNTPSADVHGPTDFAFGGSYMFLGQRQGDPLSAAVTFAVNMPTGQQGANHPAGSDVWSYQAKIGMTKIWHPNHRFDTDIGFVQPTETGNGGVRKDTTLTWQGSYHYVFNDNFDVGLEFTLDKTQSSEKNGIGMRNGYTEMYVGPAANYCLPKWNMWLGVNVLFPVLRDYDIPTASDDIRIEVKLGKLWSW